MKQKFQRMDFQIRSAVLQMNESSEEMIDFIKSHSPNTEFETKHLSSRFTMQNVFRCTFSMNAGCFDRNQNSMYLEIFSKIFTPSMRMGIKWILYLFLPRWFNANAPLE